MGSIPQTSPLYLHQSDNPGMMITQTIFDGENYDNWVEAVRVGLDSKNKLSFIDGDVVEPATGGEEESVEHVAWRQCNAMIKSWIRNVIDPKLHSSITFSASIKEIWDELQDRYAAGNAARVHQLKEELNELKQGKMSVVEYYTKLKLIWDELANYSQVPKCTCGAATAFVKDKEEEKTHQFLMGLNDATFGALRSNILIEDPIPSLSEIYGIMLREERHKAIVRGQEDRVDEAAFAARRGQPSNRGGRQSWPQPQADNDDVEEEDDWWTKNGVPAHIVRGRGRGRSWRRGRTGGRGERQSWKVNALAASSTQNQTTDHKGKGVATAADDTTPSREEVVSLRALLKPGKDGGEKSSEFAQTRSTNKMVEGYFDRLPCEILHNIVAKLPFNSIIQLRCSSKFWNNLLTDPKFIDLHLSCALEKPGYLFTNTRNSWYEENACYFVEESGGEVSCSKIFDYSNNSYESEGWDRFQSSGGLMCAYSSQSCCFRIFNPDVAEEVQIPRDSKFTRRRFRCFIFGYSPSIKKYKILKVGDLQKKGEKGFCSVNVAEVCTLGSNIIWREIQSVPSNLPYIDPQTRCQGNPFWMQESNLHFFDFVSEKFHVIPGPPLDLVHETYYSDMDFVHETYDRDIHEYFQNSLISMGDTVGYLHRNGRLWVLDDKIKGIWISRYHFSIPPFCDDVEFIGALGKGHLFGFMDYQTKAFVHDMGCTGYTVIENGFEDYEYLSTHVRSFVSPVRIMKMAKFSRKRKWILDKLKLDCDATEYDLIDKLYEFWQAYEKDDIDDDSKPSHKGRP